MVVRKVYPSLVSHFHVDILDLSCSIITNVVLECGTSGIVLPFGADASKIKSYQFKKNQTAERLPRRADSTGVDVDSPNTLRDSDSSDAKCGNLVTAKHRSSFMIHDEVDWFHRIKCAHGGHIDCLLIP